MTEDNYTIIMPGEYVPILSEARQAMPEPSRCDKKCFITVRQPKKVIICHKYISTLENHDKVVVDEWVKKQLHEPETGTEYWAWLHVESGLILV